MIQRIPVLQLYSALQPGKVVLLYGARRTGKTTLLKAVQKKLETEKRRVLFLNGESSTVQQAFEQNNKSKFQSFFGDAEFIFLDEAQVIPEIGTRLKFLVDEFPSLSVFASGSASFELSQQVGEPLVGRKKSFILYPISVSEIVNQFDFFKQTELLEQELIFGSYPEVFSLNQKEQKDYLLDVVDSYLFKDIFALANLKAPKKLKDLLVLLAFQIGQEVSLTELGTQLGMHKETISHYLDLLEKTFIIKNIRGLSRNLRSEVSKTSRYYFYDNGVRNALIQNFSPLSLRNDQGMLWENFMVMELLKKQEYSGNKKSNYFWRTYQQQEIDFVEESDGKFLAYEMKWGKKKEKTPKTFLAAYPNSQFFCVNPENYFEILTQTL